MPERWSAGRGFVLVLRPDGIGDMVLFSGALPHLRRRFPDARIETVVSRRVLNLVEHCPCVDVFHVYEEFAAGPLDWLMKCRGNRRFGRAYRWLRDASARLTGPLGRRFDVLLCPVRAMHPELHDLVRRIRARTKLGIAGDMVNQDAATDDRAGAYYTARMRLSAPDRFVHELEVTARYLKWLGCPVDGPDDVYPVFWTDARDARAAAKLLERREGERVLGLVPGSGVARKCWPADRFADVASRVRGFDKVVVLGGERERQAARLIVDRLGSSCAGTRVLDLAGRTTLRELVCVIASCDLVVGCDTGAMHMAVALGRPTVAVLGAVPHRARFYPWSDRTRHAAVYAEGEAFLQITPDEVLPLVERVMRGAAGERVRRAPVSKDGLQVGVGSAV